MLLTETAVTTATASLRDPRATTSAHPMRAHFYSEGVNFPASAFFHGRCEDYTVPAGKVVVVYAYCSGEEVSTLTTEAARDRFRIMVQHGWVALKAA